MGLWRTILSIGTSGTNAGGQLRRIHLINRITFIATVTTFYFVAHLYFIEAYYYAVVQFIVGFLCCVTFLFAAARKHEIGMWYGFVVVFLNVVYSSLELKGCGTEYFLLPLSMVPYTLLDNRKLCVLLSFLFAAAFLGLEICRPMYLPHDIIDPKAIQLTLYTDFVTVFFICAMLMYQFRLVNDKYERVIEEQVVALEEKNKEITDSIRYAKRIQTSIMPSEKFLQRTFERLRRGRPNP